MGERVMNDLKKALTEALEEAISQFDFRTAAAFYTISGWAVYSRVMELPKEEDLMMTAREIGLDAIDELVSEKTKCVQRMRGCMHVHVFERRSSYEVSIMFVPEFSMKSVSKLDVYQV